MMTPDVLTVEEALNQLRMARFWAKVDASGDCWEWTGTISDQGYGQAVVGTKTPMAHRLAFEALVGPIPKGLSLDHLCRNRACVNPDHLEPVTHLENVRRGHSFAALHARKTHCRNGHPFDEANTYIRRGGRWRDCRTCQLANAKAYKQRKRAA